jgi:transcription elongation factor GreA
MTFFLTPEGKQKLETELKELIAKRSGLSKRIELAKELGDLSENAEYHDAKDEQGMNEAHIRELENMLRHASIVEKKIGNDMVGLGSKIRVAINNLEKNYEIVGVNEAKPLEGKISGESPLGKAFLGHKIGDSVTVKTPLGLSVYEIREIK